MRVLLTCQPGAGHLYPMLPMATALTAAGHEVGVATASSFEAAVQKAGLRHFRAGLEWDEGNLEATVPEIRRVPRLEQGIWIFDHLFMDRGPKAMYPDLLDIAGRWRPDVLVVSTYEMAGVLAAERLGLPYANFNLSFRWKRSLIARVVGGRVRRLRTSLGFSPDWRCAAFGRYLDLCPMPPTWQLAGAVRSPEWTRALRRAARTQPLPALKGAALKAVVAVETLAGGRPEANTLYFRPGVTSHHPRPAVLDGLPDGPVVYVSLGTVFASQFPEVFDRLIAGLADQPCSVVMTTGHAIDPARFGTPPANVRIERFIPQDELLPHVDLVVSHGGFGSALAPMLYGVPQLVLPLSADQPIVALLAVSHGAAALAPPATLQLTEGMPTFPVVNPDSLTPAVVAGAVGDALRSAPLRVGAQRMRDRLAALPGPEAAVEALAALVK